jgi:very-short-patch-repair endonuclease
MVFRGDQGVWRLPLPPVALNARRSLDEAIAALAQRQHLVFHVAQLEALGLSGGGVRARCAKSRLFRVHKAVYSLVSPSMLSLDGRRLAAVLACGRRAALGVRDGGAVHGLRHDGRAAIDVVVAGSSHRSHPGIDVHRSTTLLRRDVTIVRGIPVTSIARTILDLAAVLRRRELDRVLEQAEVIGVLDFAALHDQIGRNAGRPAASRLAAALERWHVDLGAVWSEFEAELVEALTEFDIPQPLRNRWIVLHDGGPAIRADLQWPAQRLVVQPDGWRFHRARAAFERNTRDDQRLVAAGWLPVRLTWWQLRDERARLLGLIVGLVRERTALAASGR